jgi:hypothetical protein
MTFRRNLLLPFQGRILSRVHGHEAADRQSLGLIFNPDGGGNTLFRNVGGLYDIKSCNIIFFYTYRFDNHSYVYCRCVSLLFVNSVKLILQSDERSGPTGNQKYV